METFNDISVIVKTSPEIYKVINGINHKLFGVIWARSFPKVDVIEYFIKIATKLNLPLKIWVDDVTPQILYNRSELEQVSFNTSYEKILNDYSVDYSIVSKEYPFLKEKKSIDFFIAMRDIQITDLKYILPLKKRENSNTVLSELIHFFTQRELMNILSRETPTFLV